MTGPGTGEEFSDDAHATAATYKSQALVKEVEGHNRGW